MNFSKIAVIMPIMSYRIILAREASLHHNDRFLSQMNIGRISTNGSYKESSTNS